MDKFIIVCSGQNVKAVKTGSCTEMQEPVFGFAIELCRIRQLLYDLHQELQQSYSIVSGYIAVAVTVTVTVQRDEHWG